MIDEFARRVLSDIKEGLAGAEGAAPFSASQLKALLEASLRKLNLVSREEFDAQQAVLLRTRERLEALEKKIAELEQLQ